jgi:hypothetical protein
MRRALDNQVVKIRRAAMDPEALQKLLAQAREDPKFLHALVFDPESVLSQVDYLDRRTKSRLVGNDPEEVFATIVGARSAAAFPPDYAP